MTAIRFTITQTQQTFIQLPKGFTFSTDLAVAPFALIATPSISKAGTSAQLKRIQTSEHALTDCRMLLARVLSIAPRTSVADCFSCAVKQSKRALTNQNVKSHFPQPGHLRVFRVQASNAILSAHLHAIFYRDIFFCLSYPPLASMPVLLLRQQTTRCG